MGGLVPRMCVVVYKAWYYAVVRVVINSCMTLGA